MGVGGDDEGAVGGHAVVALRPLIRANVARVLFGALEDGEEVEGTGGRTDFFFFVKAADVPKFAIKRFPFGMRWWEDVYSGVSPGVP